MPQPSAPPAASATPQAWTPPAQVTTQPTKCSACGGNGAGLNPAEDVCLQCGWLRPLLPGYQLDRSVFLWAQDGQAMTKLQEVTPLVSLARHISDKIGRPWIESTFNGIRLGPRQLPDVWKRAILAARILGLPAMPDVYIAGDQMWQTYTFGTDNSAFIVLGTAVLNNFHDDELLFMLAREMGHCRAGHALWKTVIRFLAGDTGLHGGLLSGGILNAISPTKLIGGAIEMPLLIWSRQSDITADRAGLLAVGDEALARRVLLAWSIRSNNLLKKINLEEWMKQEDASDDQITRISELTTSTSMYTTRRLRLLGVAAREPQLMRWSQTIQPIRQRLAPPPEPKPGTPAARLPHAAPSAPAPKPAAGPTPPPAPADSIRVVCNKCQAAMRVPLAVLRGKPSLNVRCPQCHNVLTLRPKPAVPPPAPAGPPAKLVTPPPAAAGAQTKPAAPPPAAAGKTN
ncbi:MAG: M48 family metallopeptidase [Terracidiphilus sp.]